MATTVYVKTNEELAAAIKNKASFIDIQGDLANHTKRIKQIGKVAWGIAFASLTACIYSIVTAPTVAVATAGTGAVVGGAISFTGGAVTTTIIGTSTYVLAGLSIAAGSTAILKEIRDDYKIVSSNKNHLVIARK